MCCAVFRCLAAQSEQADDFPGKNPDHSRDGKRHPQRNQQCLSDAGLYPVHPASAYVLAGIGCQRGLKSVAGQVQVHLDPLPDSKGRCHLLSETVYNTLDQCQSHRDNDQLQCNRKADANSLPHAPAAPGIFPQAKAEDRIFPRHIEIGRGKRSSLRDICRGRRSCDAPVKSRHKRKIQYNIQH